MKTINRYIIKTIIPYILTVMLVWLGIYAFLNFINEIDKIGQVNYTTSKAIMYILLDLPSVIYAHSAVIILLGSLLGLSHLASTSQLIILRSCGISIMRLCAIVIKIALLLITIVILIGELIVPSTTEYAENLRLEALGHNINIKNQQGFWLKNNNTIINVKKNFNGQLFDGITLIKLDKYNRINSVTHSKKATFDGKNISLKNANNYQLDNSDTFTKITNNTHIKHNIEVPFNQTLINSLKKQTYELSTWRLYQQIKFLTKNNLTTDTFEVELYKRIIRPVTLIVMIILSMLFVFGSLRNASLGKNIFIGLMLSLFFELFSRIAGVLSLKLDYNHFLTTLMPTLIALIIALALLQHKSAR